MTGTREALARVISDHQLTGRISIGCAGCPGLEFMTAVEHAEHVAEMIAMQFLVVPQNEIVGMEFGWRRSEGGVEINAPDLDALRGYIREITGHDRGQYFEHLTLRLPLPEDGEQP
jgi:hypothetical protein